MRLLARIYNCRRRLTSARLIPRIRTAPPGGQHVVEHLVRPLRLAAEKFEVLGFCEDERTSADAIGIDPAVNVIDLARFGCGALRGRICRTEGREIRFFRLPAGWRDIAPTRAADQSSW